MSHVCKIFWNNFRFCRSKQSLSDDLNTKLTCKPKSKKSHISSFQYLSLFFYFHPYPSYSVFHRFRQAKFAYGSLILSLSKFLLLPQGPIKMTLDIKGVKFDLKIIIWLPWSKFVEHTLSSSHFSLFFTFFYPVFRSILIFLFNSSSSISLSLLFLWLSLSLSLYLSNSSTFFASSNFYTAAKLSLKIWC